MEMRSLFAARMFWRFCWGDSGNCYNCISINSWTLCWTTQCSWCWHTRQAWNSILNKSFLISSRQNFLGNILRLNLHLLWQSPWIFQSVGNTYYKEYAARGTNWLRCSPSHTNRPFSKMAAENLNKSKLKTNTGTKKSTLTLVTLPSFSISGEITAEKM